MQLSQLDNKKQSMNIMYPKIFFAIISFDMHTNFFITNCVILFVQEIIKRGYIPHIRYKREEQISHRKHHLRTVVVERTNSWHNRFRKLFTRYAKKDENYLCLVQLANSIIIY